MYELPTQIPIQIDSKIYLKDPNSSELGLKIIAKSIDMINSMGYEEFTIRKLAQAINSTEASVYRYFESKNKLLLYLISWYWSWMEYRLAFAITNINSPKLKLERALHLITTKINNDERYQNINIKKLNSIVFTESSKSYLTKDVDKVNKTGAYGEYKNFVEKVSSLILEINPKFKYPNMLVSTVIEGVHLQHHFTEHLPRLTNATKNEEHINNFFYEIVFKTIQPNKK
ncbi:MAG: TetR/AcrR family transcriptional regulator [Bacteroidota bacterium]